MARLYQFVSEGEPLIQAAAKLVKETGKPVGIWSTDFGWAYGPMPPEGDEESSPQSTPGGALMLVISPHDPENTNSPEGAEE